MQEVTSAGSHSCRKSQMKKVTPEGNHSCRKSLLQEFSPAGSQPINLSPSSRCGRWQGTHWRGGLTTPQWSQVGCVGCCRQDLELVSSVWDTNSYQHQNVIISHLRMRCIKGGGGMVGVLRGENRHGKRHLKSTNQFGCPIFMHKIAPMN